MVTLVRLLELRNASSHIVVTDEGIEYAPILPAG